MLRVVWPGAVQAGLCCLRETRFLSASTRLVRTPAPWFLRTYRVAFRGHTCRVLRPRNKHIHNKGFFGKTSMGRAVGLPLRCCHKETRCKRMQEMRKAYGTARKAHGSSSPFSGFHSGSQAWSSRSISTKIAASQVLYSVFMTLPSSVLRNCAIFANRCLLIEGARSSFRVWHLKSEQREKHVQCRQTARSPPEWPPVALG